MAEEGRREVNGGKIERGGVEKEARKLKEEQKQRWSKGEKLWGEIGKEDINKEGDKKKRCIKEIKREERRNKQRKTEEG